MKEIICKPDEHDERVLVITLNRPDRRNAMSPILVAEMLRALDSAASAEAIGAILLHGAGAGFCAGSDISALAEMGPRAKADFEAESGQLARRITAHPKPVVAALHGFAIGGGLTLAAACDIVITAEDAKWSLPEVPIGLFPAWGLEAVASRIGRPAARRLAWGIDTLQGEAAVALGLADMLAEGVYATALSLAGRLADLPRAQTAAVKAYFGQEPDWAAGDARANQLFMTACETPEAAASFVKYGSKNQRTSEN